MIASTPVSACARPSPVMTSTPSLREMRNNAVAALLEDLDDVAAEPAGGSCNCDFMTVSCCVLLRPMTWVRLALTDRDRGR